jgi:hypothetical protein
MSFLLSFLSVDESARRRIESARRRIESAVEPPENQ